MSFTKHFLYLTLLVSVVKCDLKDNKIEETDCNLPEDQLRQIQSYAPIVNEIITAVINGTFKGFAYNELAEFVDRFGARISGSQSLEDAIDYMLNKSQAKNLDVWAEDVQVPHWVRGKEWAALTTPRYQELTILGLGGSVGTPTEGIEAPVVVVRNFDELKQKDVKGKIVVYNQEFVSYGKTVVYRSKGASEAAKLGAVASLIRSITPYSMNTPHTGQQEYEANVTKIPTACITVEDARFLHRLQERGKNITISLKMEAKNLEPKTSRNSIMEIKGLKYPEKHVIVSGHIDSWDVGNGAMDDGGGAFISWSSLVLLKTLGLKPKRTIRAVLWTAEEPGLVGAYEYQRVHQNESKDLVFIMESDMGTFTPYGLQYTANNEGGCIIQEIMKLFAPINATEARSVEGAGSDITLWTENGFPGAEPLTHNDRYFWFHHSNADTMDVENSDDLDKNTAIWASVAYIIADMDKEFPK